MKKNISKINEFNILGVNVQFVLTTIVIILIICGLIFGDYLFKWCYLVGGLDLFVLAYNNKRVYHKEKLTICYIVAGVIAIIYSLLLFLGV